MIDIHPPQHGAMTRRDFFIHLSIVVLGILIAIGLEQTAEILHHAHERRQLRDDLRTEAEQKIPLLHANEVVAANGIAWYREILKASRDVTPSGGFVTFVLPPRTRTGSLLVINSAVWPAAKASGSVAVLSRDEIERWDEVDFLAQISNTSFGDREHALQEMYAIIDRTGISVNPGATIHLTIADRDELMRALSRVIETTWMLERDFALWEGGCQAMLHGATSSKDLATFEASTVGAMPK